MCSDVRDMLAQVSYGNGNPFPFLTEWSGVGMWPQIHFFFSNLANPMKEKFYLPIFPGKVPNQVPWTCLWVCDIFEPIIMAKGIENTNGPILGNMQERKHTSGNKQTASGKGKEIISYRNIKLPLFKKQRGKKTRDVLVLNTYLLNE